MNGRERSRLGQGSSYFSFNNTWKCGKWEDEMENLEGIKNKGAEKGMGEAMEKNIKTKLETLY